MPHVHCRLARVKLPAVNRRLASFVIMLAIGLQGPSLAYADAVTANTVPPNCVGHALGQSGIDDSCCPQGIAPGLCCAGGLVLSLAATRLIDSMLYGVSTLDPATYGSVLLLILLVATAASLIPAWRASRIELVQVLREE